MRLAVHGGRGLRAAGGSALETVVVDGEATEATWAAFIERVGVVQRQGHDVAVARSTFSEFVVARGGLVR
jgi:hypothetical protein